MRKVSVRLWTFPCLLLMAAPAGAQEDDHRIWGRVLLTSGERHEGFIRWDRNEGSWGDVLDGSKELSEEIYETWRQAWGTERPRRTIDLMGYRVSWNEIDPDFPLVKTSGIRFGHLASIAMTGRNSADLTLRSGHGLEFIGGATDIGWSMRELIVEEPGRGETDLDWDEVERIDFTAVPTGMSAESPRLYGTAEDRTGRRFTGYISWDLDEIFESDVLDGRDEDWKDRDIKFEDISSIRRTVRGSRVVLKSGADMERSEEKNAEEADRSVEISLLSGVELSGTNDVERGNRGIQISDPALGMVEVEWDDFEVLHFEEPPDAVGYDAFDGGRLLFGTLVTQSGEEIQGRIRWDADEEWSWEFLNGSSDGVLFKVEFGQISKIVRGDVFGATVTLLDGRRYELDDSNDVNWDNRGIFVQETPSADQVEDAPWRLVPWDEFLEVRFESPLEQETGGGPNS